MAFPHDNAYTTLKKYHQSTSTPALISKEPLPLVLPHSHLYVQSHRFFNAFILRRGRVVVHRGVKEWGGWELSERRKKREIFYQAYEWRVWDRWHCSKSWRGGIVGDGVKGRRGGGKLSHQIMETCSYKCSSSVNLNSKFFFLLWTSLNVTSSTSGLVSFAFSSLVYFFFFFHYNEIRVRWFTLL